MLILALSSLLWAGPYRQTFHVTAAVPLTISHHSTAGFTSNSWMINMVVLTTAERVTFKVRCSSNSGWKLAQRWLETSTNYAFGLDERNATAFLEELPTAEACSAKVDDLLDAPSTYEISILEAKKLELKKIESNIRQ